MERVFIIGVLGKPYNNARYLIQAAGEIGFEVDAFDPMSEGASEGSFIRQVDAFKPKYVLIQKGFGFRAAWNEILKQKGIYTILWHPDPDLPDWLIPLARSVHFCFTMAEGMIPEWEKAGVQKVAWLSQGILPSFFRVDPMTEADRRFYGSEVAFVGNIDSSNDYLPRRYKLERVLREGFALKWWGPRLGRKLVNLPLFFSALGRAWGGRFVYGPEFAKVALASKVLLAFDRHAHIRRSMSARMYTAVGCGAFYLCEAVEGIETVLAPGKEIVTFRGEDEMIEKIRYYLPREEERKAIARAGQARVLREHTYQKRLERMFELVRQADGV